MLTRSTHEFDLRAPTPWYGTGLGALMIVLVVIGSMAWAVRRWIPSARSTDSHLLRVVGRTAVSPKHSLALVHVGRRVVLVGIGGERLTALSEFREADEVAELLSRSGSKSAPADDRFDELLERRAAEFGAADETGDTEPAPISGRGVARYREPLNDLLRRLRTLQVK